jgi:hypothetical protein
MLAFACKRFGEREPAPLFKKLDDRPSCDSVFRASPKRPAAALALEESTQSTANNGLVVGKEKPSQLSCETRHVRF